MDDSRLLDAARDASEKAYDRYSNYPVGAAVLDEQGRLHVGCNVENASFPEGICAEANAIGSMVVAGGTKIVSIAVWSGAGDAHRCTPCGGCRQRIAEFADESTRILLTGEEGAIRVLSVEDLLPDSFSLR